MGALDGIAVIELASADGVAPAAGAVLADWGAEVVRLDPPTPGAHADLFDPLVEQVNRSKRSVALDPVRPETRELFQRLVARADVLLTDLDTAELAQLRAQPDELFRVNPRLVYGRATPVGRRGQAADVPASDVLAFWGRGGIGHQLTPEDADLVLPRPGMGDSVAGLALAGGVAAALLQRTRTGKGVTVDVSLLGSAVWTLASDLVTTSVTGTNPRRDPAERPRANPLVGTYRTSDGRWLLLDMVDSDDSWPGFCEALGRQDLMSRISYADARSRAANAAALRGIITDTIASRPLGYWRPRFDDHGCTWSAMASCADVLADPQVAANDYLPPLPGDERARLVASPVEFDGRAVEVRSPAPRPGQDTEAILAELGVDAERLRVLREVGAVG